MAVLKCSVPSLGRPATTSFQQGAFDQRMEQASDTQGENNNEWRDQLGVKLLEAAHGTRYFEQNREGRTVDEINRVGGIPKILHQAVARATHHPRGQAAAQVDLGGEDHDEE